MGGRKQYYGRTAKRAALWSVFRQGGHEFIAIPTSMVMARLLSFEDFGVAAVASLFILLASRLTQFGLSAALVRVKELRAEHVSSVFVVNLTMGILAYTIIFAVAPSIGRFFRSADVAGVLPIAALIFVISPFGTVSAALLQRNMQFRYATLADWTDAVVGAAVSVFLAFRGFGYWSIVYGNLVAVAVRVVLQEYLAGWKPTLKFSRRAVRELISFGLGVQTKRLLEYATFNVDNLLIGRLLGISALGLYDKAFTTMNRLVTRLTLGQAPFRIFSIIHEDGERFRRAYSRLILSATLIGFPAFAGCIVVARPLFTLLYGERWLPAVVPYQWLCVGGMLKLLNAYASQCNEAAGNIWPQVRRQAVGTILIGVGAGIGSVYGGLTGVAIGVVAAMMILTVAMQALARRATGLTWRAMLAPQIPAVTCAALLVCVLLATGAALRAAVPEPAAWQLLLTQATTGGLFYAGFVLFSPFAAVRDIVRETIDDLLPPGSFKALSWRRKPATPPA